MSAYEVRPASEADSEFLFALHKTTMGAYVEAIWGWDDGEQRDMYLERFEPGASQIILVGGVDAGVLKVERREHHTYLGLIEIDPRFGNHGIGRSIIERLIEEAGQPVELDVLVVNTRAKALYERLGFVEQYRHAENDVKIHMRHPGKTFSLEDADRLAARLHEGQVDKAGEPYIEHPRAVARITKELGGNEEQQLAALLHDTVEDTECTLDDLRKLGIPERVVAMVDALTKRAGEPKEFYFVRIKQTPGAPEVKRADITHNTDPERLARLDEATRDRLRIGYARSLELLEGE